MQDCKCKGKHISTIGVKLITVTTVEYLEILFLRDLGHRARKYI